MEITWKKDTCFLLKGKKTNVVINPTGDAGKLKAEIVLHSSGEDLAEVEGVKKVFDWPGEYEISDVPINGFPAHTSDPEKEGAEDTVIFKFILDEIKVCHLGKLGHKLSNELVDKIGDVDVLMIRVGEGSNLDNKTTMDVIESIEPRIVIPMGSGSPAAELKDVGADKIEAIDKLAIDGAASLPVDEIKYVVLKES